MARPDERYIWLGIDPRPSETGYFFFYNFFGTSYKRFNVSKLHKMERGSFLDLCKKYIQGKLTISFERDDDEKFIKDFRDIKNVIDQSHEITKLVGVARGQYHLNHRIHPLSQVLELNKLEGALYGIWNREGGVLGVSPEPLFVKENNHWRTRSLAGTISTDVENYKDVLLGDAKERHEHRLVIEDIVESLTPFAKSVEVGETIVREFGQIAHLQTDIKFESKNLNAKKILEILSPTAALGGYPRIKAKKALQNLEYFKFAKESRSFGGIFGIDCDADRFGLVGIRNIYWDFKKMKAEIHSGCGIVYESIEQNELAEIRKKRNVISGIFDEQFN